MKKTELEMEYSMTGLVMLCMLGYGLFALLFERIRFNLLIVGVLVLGTLFIETSVYYFSKVLGG